MASALRNVAAPVAHSGQPALIGEGPVDLRIDTSLPDSGISDAGEIGFPRNARAETDIQRVIPDVELPGVGCVHGRDEVNSVGVGHIHNVLIGPDAVEA